MAITNQLEIVKPWESLSLRFLTEHNLAIFKNLSQTANVWHCGDIAKGKFHNPHTPVFVVRDWSIIPTEIWGLIDLHCQGHLFCFMLSELDHCPVATGESEDNANLRFAEWLKQLIEEVS